MVVSQVKTTYKSGGPNWPDSYKTCVRPLGQCKCRVLPW